MENEEHLLPLAQPPRRRDQEPNPEWDRASAFSKEVIGITGSAIMAGVSGYKDMATGSRSLLFEAGGLSLLLTFISAVVLMNFQLHVPPGAWNSRYADLSSAILVIFTSFLLMATNTMFVALMNKGDTVLVILVLPVVLVLCMLAGADLPADAAAPAGTAEEQDRASEDSMKSDNELASFGATAAFAIEGGVILGYLKYPSFGGGSHSQVDLAVSFFAATISVLAMMVTALPVRSLFPSTRARLVAVVGHRLKRVMLAALMSMAMILAVEILEWWFMLSLLPEVIACTLNVAMMSWREVGGVDAPRPARAGVDDGEGARRERMVKGFKGVATMSFTLMAGTYAVYLGHSKYDVYLRAAMLVMLAAIVSSLRQILRPFDLDLPRARGWCAVAVGAVSLIFPGLALVIAGPLLVKIFVHFYFEAR